MASCGARGNAKVAWVKYDANCIKNAIEIMKNAGIRPSNY